MEHESKCKDLHGHRYTVEATFAAKGLDTLGRVIDFAEVRKVLGSWIDENWDHTTILFDQDKALGEKIISITKQKIFYLPYNPTVENLAKYLLETVCPSLFEGSDASCRRIKIWETPNCSAEALLQPF